MQSQLAAALTGHQQQQSQQQQQQQQNVVTNTTEEDEAADEEADDVDEFIDEDYDAESGSRTGKFSSATSIISRTVTLQMLLSADILQPGEGTMSIEYLGQRFIGDLLPDGKIRSQETDIVFASPSAWAINCKRIINPEKKSGCGWASVRYRGKKLDAYKNIWYKKKKEEELLDKIEDTSDNEMEAEQIETKLMAAPYPPIQRIVVKHNTIANRTFTHDSNTLIECVPFSNLGKIQPFLISISTNALFLLDFHCHLTTMEVSGYLAGQWDVNAHTLTISHTFPCRNTKADRELAPQVEAEIQKAIEQQQLTLVGWYHSHPTAPAAPTLRDIDAQLDYQIRMKGNSDSSYSPCVGLICSPYNSEYTSLDSAIICYWVMPPPETKPNEYGRPMLMSYNVMQESTLPAPIMEEMKKCGEYYKKEKTFVNFADSYQPNTTYLETLKTSLSSKFPRDQNDGILWGFIKEVIGYSGDDKIDTSTLLTVPNLTTKSVTTTTSATLAPNLSTNLMLTSNLANVLFSSGKFPSTGSLLGLPDPMAQSTLAANNMFLSPSLFKMQELLKPMVAPKAKPKVELKTPMDLNVITMKNKLDYGIPELSLPKANFSPVELLPTVRSFGASASISASDFSVSSVKGEQFGMDGVNVEATPAKVSKTDFSMLDLTSGTSKPSFIESLLFTNATTTTASNEGSFNQITNNKPEISITSETPMNLSE